MQPQGTFGEVEYSYRISKYEVTNGQYIEFLNAVASKDAHGLYNSLMESDPSGGIIRRDTNGSYTYEVKPGRLNNPVAFVSFFDAMRFANWLENGQPTGPQDSSTTEDGVYLIGNGINEVRATSSRYFLPGEDEWYKAAYHKNDGATGNFWKYPTSSDTVPFSAKPPGDDAQTN